MKIPLLLSVALLPCLAFAQTTPTTPAASPGTAPAGDSSSGEHHGPRHHFSPEKQLEFLTKKLELSTIQQGQVKTVLETTQTQMKAIHENTSLTEDQKHEQSKALFESSKKQIIALLNPAQVAQFKELRQQHGHPHDHQQTNGTATPT